jgi:hypothetical protein
MRGPGVFLPSFLTSAGLSSFQSASVKRYGPSLLLVTAATDDIKTKLLIEASRSADSRMLWVPPIAVFRTGSGSVKLKLTGVAR